MQNDGDFQQFVPVQFENHGQQPFIGGLNNRLQHQRHEQVPSQSLAMPERAFSQNAFVELDIDSGKKHEDGTFGIKSSFSRYKDLKDPMDKHMMDEHISTPDAGHDQALRAVRIANQMASDPVFMEKITPEVDGVVRAFRNAISALLDKNAKLHQELLSAQESIRSSAQDPPRTFPANSLAQQHSTSHQNKQHPPQNNSYNIQHPLPNYGGNTHQIQSAQQVSSDAMQPAHSSSAYMPGNNWGVAMDKPAYTHVEKTNTPYGHGDSVLLAEQNRWDSGAFFHSANSAAQANARDRKSVV